MERPENKRAIGKKYAREIFSRLPLNTQLTLKYLSEKVPSWLPRLKNGAWRPLMVGILALQMAACKPTRGFEDQTPHSTTPIVEPYHPQPTPELTPISPLELTPTPEPTPMATPGPTISGETLTISDSQLELKEFDGEAIAQLINASEKGWQVITNDKGKISFFSGYAGEAGKESQVVVLAQGPENYQWNPDNQLWQKDNQVVIPDILLPGGWNEEKQMAGPAYEADTVFLFKDESGNYRIGVVYNPEKVAQISDKSNLEILPDGSGLFVGSPKNYELQEGQQMIRDEDGNLRLTNADGSYFLMRTSWSKITSPNQLYQAGTFAGPFETQPTLPYPTDEIVQTLGITDYQVVNNHPVALQTIIDQQTGETHQYIIAQAKTNKEGEFTGWQKTIPFAIETGLVVPHPQETNPELFDTTNPYSPIVQFANAFGVKPEEVGNLKPKLLTGVDGKQFVVLTTGDLTATKGFDESGTPLMIAKQEENGEWRWNSQTILADLFRVDGMFFGFTYRMKNNIYRKGATAPDDLIANYSSMVTPEDNFYQPFIFNPKPIKWSVIDEYIDFLQKYPHLVSGPPHLYWAADTNEEFPHTSQNQQELVSRTKQILKRYGKIIHMWDINELFNEDGSLRNPNALENAIAVIKTIRDIDPTATIIINDWAMERQPGKDNALYNFVSQLFNEGLLRPGDIIGYQGHNGIEYKINPMIFAKWFDRYAKLGLNLRITEVDFIDADGSPADEVKKAKIIMNYYRAGQILKQKYGRQVLDGIIMWGSIDNSSWYEDDNRSKGYPLLLDKNGHPHLSWFLINQELLKELLKNSD